MSGPGHFPQVSLLGFGPGDGRRDFPAQKRLFLRRSLLALSRARSVGFMVAHVALRWLRRQRPPVAWQLGIGVTKVGERSLAVGSALFDGADCLATSSSVMVVIDHATRRPASMNEATRALLAPFVLAAA